MKHPWNKAILTTEDQAEIDSAMTKIAIVLIGARMVAQELPYILDKKLGPIHVEGS